MVLSLVVLPLVIVGAAVAWFLRRRSTLLQI